MKTPEEAPYPLCGLRYNLKGGWGFKLRGKVKREAVCWKAKNAVGRRNAVHKETRSTTNRREYGVFSKLEVSL